MKSKRVRNGLLLLQLGAAALAGMLAQGASAQETSNATKSPTAKESGERVYRDIKWDELMPKGWDPAKMFKDMNLDNLRDGDPRAVGMLRKMRELMNNAPTNAELNGAAVKIPGYLVPLEESKGGISEFLLVPYFGACIHTPPPPSNQIIHVKMSDAVKDVRSMSAIWVSGTIKTLVSDTFMGVSGYRMDGMVVTPYQPSRPAM